jgi:lipoprotein NlpD
MLNFFKRTTMPRALLALLSAAVLLSACATKVPAPVADRRPPTSATSASAPTSSAASASATSSDAKPGSTDAAKNQTHTIQKGETLIAIALQYGLDYRELAMWNNIENPNIIKEGAMLRVTPPGTEPAKDAGKDPKPGQPIATPLTATAGASGPSAASERPAQNTASSKVEPRGGKVPYADETLARLNAQAAQTNQANQGAQSPSSGGSAAPASNPASGAASSPTSTSNATAAASTGTPTPAGGDDVEWSWPLKGKVVANFTEANKGIDIAGSKGTPVLAAAPGRIVYSGSGIRGYGRLVIVKHSAMWLSAYAHNDKIVVNEGQEVKRGQKIAEVGNSDAEQFKLHFEIRKNGRPQDPAKLLPAQ